MSAYLHTDINDFHIERLLVEGIVQSKWFAIQLIENNDTQFQR